MYTHSGCKHKHTANDMLALICMCVHTYMCKKYLAAIELNQGACALPDRPPHSTYPRGI